MVLRISKEGERGMEELMIALTNQHDAAAVMLTNKRDPNY